MTTQSVQVSSNVLELNPFSWYFERCLSYCPVHFRKATTPITNESLDWIYEKLQGRFYVVRSTTTEDESTFLSPFFQEVVYFEDPQEAIHYELRWS